MDPWYPTIRPTFTKQPCLAARPVATITAVGLNEFTTTITWVKTPRILGASNGRVWTFEAIYSRGVYRVFKITRAFEGSIFFFRESYCFLLRPTDLNGGFYWVVTHLLLRNHLDTNFQGDIQEVMSLNKRIPRMKSPNGSASPLPSRNKRSTL